MIQGRTRTSIREGPCFRILGWHISASCQKRGGGIASPKIKTTFSVEQAPLPTTGKRWGSSSVERGGIHRKIIFKSPVRKNIYNNKDKILRDSRGGPAVKDPLANAEDLGLISGPGGSHMLCDTKAPETQLLEPRL